MKTSLMLKVIAPVAALVLVGGGVALAAENAPPAEEPGQTSVDEQVDGTDASDPEDCQGDDITCDEDADQQDGDDQDEHAQGEDEDETQSDMPDAADPNDGPAGQD